MRALAVALLLALPAAAQGPLPGAAVAEMTLEGSLPDGLRPGAVGVGTLVLALRAHTFACAQPGAVDVALEVDEDGAAEGVVLAVDNATRVAVPAGVYTEQTPFAAEAAPNASLLVARYAAPAAASTFVVRARVAAVNGTACTLGDLSAVAAEATLAATLASIPPGDPDFHPEHEEHGGFVFDKLLRPGESYTWTPTEPGRYPYHDHFRPDSKGLVRVLRVAEGAASPTIRLASTGFAPAEVAVKVGTPVTWTNTDSVTRSVSADEQHGVTSGVEPEDAAALANRSTTGPADPNGTPLPWALAALAVLVAARRRR